MAPPQVLWLLNWTAALDDQSRGLRFPFRLQIVVQESPERRV